MQSIPCEQRSLIFPRSWVFRWDMKDLCSQGSESTTLFAGFLKIYLQCEISTWCKNTILIKGPQSVNTSFDQSAFAPIVITFKKKHTCTWKQLCNKQSSIEWPCYSPFRSHLVQKHKCTLSFKVQVHGLEFECRGSKQIHVIGGWRRKV